MRTTRRIAALAALLGACAASDGSVALGSPSADVAGRGGIITFDVTMPDINVDPSQGYAYPSWQLEYATALKLVNYPDKPKKPGVDLVAEAATSIPKPTNHGKRYTFKIKKGLKFPDGSAVTAGSFKVGIERTLYKSLHSPGASIFGGISGYASALRHGQHHASGLQVSGNKLIIRLTKPDGGFLHRLATPFAQAIPANMPPSAVAAFPSAGPYYISHHDANGLLLDANPFYTGARPHNVDGFVLHLNVPQQQALAEIRAGEADGNVGELPLTSYQQLATDFGVNTGRFQVHPLFETDYIALNTRRPLFRSKTMRKAVNYAVNRPALGNPSPYASTATDQILPPGAPGFRDAKIYPLKAPNVEKAKRLAGSKHRTASIWTNATTNGLYQAEVLQHDLQAIGIDSKIRSFPPGQLYDTARRDHSYDALFAAASDFPDPYDYLNKLLSGESLAETNLSYFNNAKVNALLKKSAAATGSKRYKTYGKLDVTIMRNYAPVVSYGNANERRFFSDRIDPQSYVFHSAYATDLAALALR